MVFTLTDHESPLLRLNSQLTLPDASYLAKVLRENDVTGLALLTEVTTHCLRDELGIKSLGHRASINHLIRQLQQISPKYQEQTQRSASLSSVGFGSPIRTSYLTTPSYEPRAGSRAIGSVISPINSSVQWQDHFRLDNPPAHLRDVLQEGPKIQGFDRPNETRSRSLEDLQDREDSGINMTEGISDSFKPAKTTSNPAATALSHEERSLSISPIAEQAEWHGVQSETIVIDQTGKKRRRLVLGHPGTSGSVQTIAARSLAFEELPSSPETLRRDANANTSFESSYSPTSDCPAFDEEQLLIPREPQVSVQTATPTLDSALKSARAAAEPGVLEIDENGRKRMRPIVVHEIDQDLEDERQLRQTSKKQEIEPANYVQPYSYGRKARRNAGQIYLGLESMPVDNLIYGDVASGNQTDERQTCRISSQAEQPDESLDLNIVPNNGVGKGQRLYVNARMKYLLRDRRVSLKRDGLDHIAVIPYPDRISRKNCPLFMTIFSPSSHGVTSLRVNRSHWLKERLIPDASEANAFHIADTVLVHDETDDPEWRALEKWNFMDGEDTVLPVYGESDSEGEYDLETWREMEKEQGKITRPLGRSRGAKLNSADVQDAIDLAMKQIVQDWTLKRLPKLKLKGWRLWTKARRNRILQSQIKSFTRNLEMLETRIGDLRKEIAQEEWSKTSQINKQCKIIQPSIFDREDYKWKILTLGLQEAPEKPARAITQPRLAQILEPEAMLADGEEVFTASNETSSSSGNDLDDFIIEDDADEDLYQPVIVDHDLTMADVEDDIHSDTLIIDKAKLKTPTKPVKSFNKDGPSPSNVIDLTQRSDRVDPEDFASKPERSFGIRTPPLYGSDNDSEIFQRSRSKKLVFRLPSAVAESVQRPTEIISLDSDSNESVGCRIPALSDVQGIRAMDSADLVERQDRKRLLIWTVAHTEASGRRAAFRFLRNISMEASRTNVTSVLKKLLLKRYPKYLDNADMNGVMRVAGWRVCWTIPVKVTSEGLQKSHILATLEDDDGYEPFYEFLLECLQHYRGQEKSKKKRELIDRHDSDNEGHLDSQIRKRKYFVPESQETLDKRHAAQDRLRANEERRRREELESRFTKMSTGSIDSSKVVVNPGKLADQDFIYLNSRFGNGARMKSHQEEGLQFLWREITSEHQDLQGCLLAQTMGLGKTMQVIALLVTLSEAARSSNKKLRNQVPPTLRESRTLILCPPALVENWWDECLLWPPLPLSDNIGELRKVNSVMNQTDRLIEIDAWSKGGGILLIGYDTFKSLIHNRPRISSKTKERKAPLDDQQHKMVQKALLDRPTLVVADEAHQFKSKSSKLNLAMNQIKTRSRIALTGSPLNNNLGEYHSLIDWIAPGYLGNDTEFRATYEEPIREGLYQDSTVSQYRESRKRLKALELELEPKVHRANVSCLHAELNGKSEFVIRVPLTELQRDLYCIYAERMLATSRGEEPGLATLWSWLEFLRLLCNHPKCYMDKLLAVEHGLRGTESAPQKKKALTSLTEEALVGSDDEVAISDGPVSRIALSQIKDESQKVLQSQVRPIDTLILSHKAQVLMDILNISQEAQDKILVFSHSIPSLDYIGEQLLKMHKAFVRIDGKVHTQKRQSMTKAFNEGDINICLVSTRAGGQGLNLFGANRIVILDDHFNPMWEQQAIGRAYRIGQKKHVYVYRLTVGGTFEQAIQNQALFKEQLATRVVDKMNPNRRALKGAGDYLFPPKTVEQEDLSQFLGKDPVLDRLLGAETG